jgi:hypothetical protein
MSKDLDRSRCWIYVIGPVKGAQKIGITSDIDGRLRSYKTHSSENIKVHFKQNCPRWRARRIEREVHSVLKDKRVHGEWFDVSPKKAIYEVTQMMLSFEQPCVQIDQALLNFRFEDTVCYLSPAKWVSLYKELSLSEKRKSKVAVEFVDMGTWELETNKSQHLFFPSTEDALEFLEIEALCSMSPRRAKIYRGQA